jgi:hypothetical protein
MDRNSTLFLPGTIGFMMPPLFGGVLIRIFNTKCFVFQTKSLIRKMAASPTTVKRLSVHLSRLNLFVLPARCHNAALKSKKTTYRHPLLEPLQIAALLSRLASARVHWSVGSRADGWAKLRR